MTIFLVLEQNLLITNAVYVYCYPSGQNRQRNSPKECVFVNSALKYSAMLSKIHYYRLFFRRFCLLGCANF